MRTTTPVVLCGPYGRAFLPKSPLGWEGTNLLAIAGGTGISLTLPLVLAATSSPVFAGAAITLIWIIRRRSNLSWIESALEELRRPAVNGCHDVRIRVFVTREDDASALVEREKEKEKENEEAITTIRSTTSASSRSVGSAEKGCRSGVEKNDLEITYLLAQRPSLHDIVATFMETRASTKCRTRVVASGPASMGSDLRGAVASMNDGAKVWRGDRKWDVSLDWDDRIG